MALRVGGSPEARCARCTQLVRHTSAVISHARPPGHNHARRPRSRFANKRRPATLLSGRFPAERLVPEGFRGPNVLEKLAAGAQGEDVHAENLAFLFERVGHAMKAQDKKTRRLREEGGAQQPPRRLETDPAMKGVRSSRLRGGRDGPCEQHVRGPVDGRRLGLHTSAERVPRRSM